MSTFAKWKTQQEQSSWKMNKKWFPFRTFNIFFASTFHHHYFLINNQLAKSWPTTYIEKIIKSTDFHLTAVIPFKSLMDKKKWPMHHQPGEDVCNNKKRGSLFPFFLIYEKRKEIYKIKFNEDCVSNYWFLLCFQATIAQSFLFFYY